MKFEIRALEIEMIPETEFDHEVLAKLRRAHEVEVKDGRTSDHRNWPPDPRKTNLVLKWDDPNKW